MSTQELIDYGKWLSKNNFSRNSMGIWGTNCSSFRGMNDDEIVDMYVNNPNKLQDHLKVVRQKIVSELEKQLQKV